MTGGDLGLLVALDPAGGEPLRRQLAGELREAIRAGRLRTGVRLPASRALAAQLGVSRGVVTDAYEQLSAEGWLAARRGAGTIVAAGPAGEPERTEAPRRAVVRFDFTATTPDVSLFPRRPWARAVARAAAEAPDAELDYGSGFGSLPLRAGSSEISSPWSSVMPASLDLSKLASIAQDAGPFRAPPAAASSQAPAAPAERARQPTRRAVRP